MRPPWPEMNTSTTHKGYRLVFLLSFISPPPSPLWGKRVRFFALFALIMLGSEALLVIFSNSPFILVIFHYLPAKASPLNILALMSYRISAERGRSRGSLFPPFSSVLYCRKPASKFQTARGGGRERTTKYQPRINPPPIKAYFCSGPSSAVFPPRRWVFKSHTCLLLCTGLPAVAVHHQVTRTCARKT